MNLLILVVFISSIYPSEIYLAGEDLLLTDTTNVDGSNGTENIKCQNDSCIQVKHSPQGQVKVHGKCQERERNIFFPQNQGKKGKRYDFFGLLPKVYYFA